MQWDPQAVRAALAAPGEKTSRRLLSELCEDFRREKPEEWKRIEAASYSEPDCAAAQRACREQYLDQLENGSVIPCTVTHIENFGAFCDVGCGISALLPIDCLSVSRIASPADRVTVGQQLLCAIKNRDEQDRIVLTLRELLGTWSENAACFAAGETVVGIVRSVEDYGVFIEIAPNLAGLAEPDTALHPGQTVSVYIKSILPDKMKIKLVVVNKNLNQKMRFEPHYFVTRGRLDRWIYSTPQSRKQIETVF